MQCLAQRKSSASEREMNLLIQFRVTLALLLALEVAKDWWIDPLERGHALS